MFESFNAPTGPNWALRIVLAVVSLALGAGIVSLWRMTQMPLRSYRGPLPSLSSEQSRLAGQLADHVRNLSVTIGERNIRRPGSLRATTEYLRACLTQSGYSVTDRSYVVEGQVVRNLETELAGSEGSAGVVVVGAHYDSVAGTVGADDNATGVAATLELA